MLQHVRPETAHYPSAKQDAKNAMRADAESEDGIKWDLGETPLFLADGVSPPSPRVRLLPFVAS